MIEKAQAQVNDSGTLNSLLNEENKEMGAFENIREMFSFQKIREMQKEIKEVVAENQRLKKRIEQLEDKIY